MLRYQLPVISIHTPLTRCDISKSRYWLWSDISIHTPLTRCDDIYIIKMVDKKYFNPHTSHEVRLQHHLDYLPTYFISIHTPLTRCDMWLAISMTTYLFQSTHLSRGATSSDVSSVYVGTISIHTPLTRCDLSEYNAFVSAYNISIHTPLTRCDIIDLLIYRV